MQHQEWIEVIFAETMRGNSVSSQRNPMGKSQRWILATVCEPLIKSHPELGIYFVMVYLLLETFATARCQTNTWGNSRLIVNKSVLHHQRLE